MIAVVILVAPSSAYSFTPDAELEAYADRVSGKFFPIFIQTLDMINGRTFDELPSFFSRDLLNDNRPMSSKVSVKEWHDNPNVFFSPSQFDSVSYEITFPINWGADPQKNTTWVFHFHSLLWLNEYLENSKDGDNVSSLIAFKIIRDWITANSQWPPKFGRFVYGDHSTAKRLEVFYKAMRLYKASQFKDEEFFNLLLTGIVNHIALMATNERYLNWHNHGIIFDLSLLEVLDGLKEFRMREEIQNLATRRCVEQFKFVFTSEGIHKEHSPCYHYFVSQMIGKAIKLIRKSGNTIPDFLENLQCQATEFLFYVLEPDTTFPNFGDCSGHIKWLNNLVVSTTNCEHNLELDFSLTTGKHGRKPSIAVRVFPESGWAIFRDSWPPNVYAAIQSDFYSKAHYQEDDTSFILYAFGQDLIIDSGIYTYDKRPLDIYMRKARAHNVLLVDDTDFNSTIKNTGLSGITRFLLKEDSNKPGNAIVELTHPHYETSGVTIYRQFGQINGHSFVIKDIVQCESSHKYTQLFHIAPDPKIASVNQGVFKITWTDHPYVLWLKSEFDSYDIVQGSEDPVQGWFFPKFGVALPQPVLRLHKKGASTTFQTLISVCRGKDKPLWTQIDKAAGGMCEAIEALSRRKLEKQPVPARWIPSRKAGRAIPAKS